MESVLALESNCFSHSDSLKVARQAEAEVLPLLEVYSNHYKGITDPVIPEILHCFPQGLWTLILCLFWNRNILYGIFFIENFKIIIKTVNTLINGK